MKTDIHNKDFARTLPWNRSWSEVGNSLFLVFTQVMRRPCWHTKQWENIAQILHNNRIIFPKDFFSYCPVHQHGRHDVTWKTRIAGGANEEYYEFILMKLWVPRLCHCRQMLFLMLLSGSCLAQIPTWKQQQFTIMYRERAAILVSHSNSPKTEFYSSAKILFCSC